MHTAQTKNVGLRYANPTSPGHPKIDAGFDSDQLTQTLIIINLSRWNMGHARLNSRAAEFPLRNG